MIDEMYVDKVAALQEVVTGSENWLLIWVVHGVLQVVHSMFEVLLYSWDFAEKSGGC
jgi:hypothetical protein